MTDYVLQGILKLDSSEFESGLNNAKSLAGGFASGIGSIMKVGAVAIGAATTAVGAFAKSSVDAGMQFDSSMSQVAATMGKTMDEMQNEVGTVELAWGTFSGNLREFAQEMGQNTMFSATQAADALNYMALAGYSTQESMTMLPNVLNLAAAGSMDLARASDMVTDTQTAFGMTAERTAQMVDEMAKAASTGNTSVEQLGDAFLVVGGLAQELNGGMVTLEDGTSLAYDNVQELEIALTAMANAGIKGGEAGTHLRNMLLKLASPTDAGVKQLQALGVSVFDTEGNMRSLAAIMEDLGGAMDNLTQKEKLQAISDLFNTRDTAAAEALLKAVDEDWSDIAESILDADGAAQKMADTQKDNLAGDITIFKSALEAAQIAISDGLSPALRDFVKLGTSGLSDMTAAFKKDGLEGAMTSFGDTISKGLSMITEKAPEAVDAGMMLLSAIGQGLMDNSDAIIDSAIEIAGMFGSAIVEGAPGVIDAGTDLLKKLLSGIAEKSDAIKEGATSLLTNLVTALTEDIPDMAESAVTILIALAEGLIGAIPEVIPTLVEVILGLVDVFVEHVGDFAEISIQLMTALSNGLIQALPILIEKAPEIITKLAEALINNFPLLVETQIQLIIMLAAALVQCLPQLLVALEEIFVGIWTALLEKGATLIEGVATWFSTLIENIKSFMAELPTMAGEFVGSMAAEFINGIVNLINSLPEKWEQIKQQVINFGTQFVAEAPRIANKFKDELLNKLKNIIPQIKEVGANIIQGLVDGLKEGWEKLKGVVSEFADGVVSGFTSKLQIESPSKVMADKVGKWIPAGIAEGIIDGVGAIDDAMDVAYGEITATPAISSTGVDNSQIISLLQQIRDEGRVQVTLEGDADRLFRAMQKKATANYRLTGNPGMVMA